jgi:hypothetical protein
LKDELASLKSGSSAITTSSPVEGSPEELAAKLLAYQQFMAKYIVKSQEDKMKAIKAAEQATAKKYEEKMAFLLGSSQESISATPADSATPVLSGNQALYQKRNAAVSEAAKAGKSRWGDKEAQRAAQQVGGASVASAAVETSPPSSVLSGVQALYRKRNEAVSEAAKARKSRWGDLEVERATDSLIDVTAINGELVIEVPPEVEKADHGMRADGGVGGPSLAERVVMGAAVLSATPAPSATPVLSGNQALYQKRNAMVSAAAKAGKSRWGDMEVQKATQLALVQPTPTTVSPQFAAADHGLRSDGSVGGPSLTERVNLGAQLLKSM